MTCSSNSHVSLILTLLAQIQVGSWYQGTNLVEDVIAITLITSVSKGYYKRNKILARVHTELLVGCSCVEKNANSKKKGHKLSSDEKGIKLDNNHYLNKSHKLSPRDVYVFASMNKWYHFFYRYHHSSATNCTYQFLLCIITFIFVKNNTGNQINTT